MKYIIPALLLVALMGYVAWYWQQAPTYGTTITTINSTDKLSDSRTTINNNFSALLNGKEDISDLISTTSLPSLAIAASQITGTLSAANGGTGTTSPTLNQVMFGNGASGFTVIGFGSNGQFLTSSGAGALPSWTSTAVNQASDYTWTGKHTFNGATTTIVAEAIATSTQFGVYGGMAPTGSMIAYASSTPPAGWLLCDGSSVLRSAYPQLFQVIGTTYGSADGTHFTLPNLSGRTPVMASTTANVAQSGGEDLHTLTQAQLPNVNFTFTGSYEQTSAGAGSSHTYMTNSGTTNVPSGGSGTAFNVRDPYLAVEYIIKY